MAFIITLSTLGAMSLALLFAVGLWFGWRRYRDRQVRDAFFRILNALLSYLCNGTLSLLEGVSLLLLFSVKTYRLYILSYKRTQGRVAKE
jgi:hypothetical protein